MPPEALAWLMSPLGLGVLGLMIGSFLNVVVYRKPVMLEREWAGDAARYLQDDASMGRVLGAQPKVASQLAQAGKLLEAAVDALPALTLSRPRSRCPHCGHAIAWHEKTE